MCGIVGYVGKKQAVPVLIGGLKKLEYRGYDSAGIAVRCHEEPIGIVKAKGKLKNLEEKLQSVRVCGGCGIGHTRWATHGDPSENNAHPHRSDDGCVVGVHNGIIENYREIKEKLLRHGYSFYSETDTEVLVKLVDYYYKKYRVGPIDALAKTMVRVRGAYALAVLFEDYPEEIYVARKDSPMVIGVSEGDTYLASDVPAMLEHTRDVYYIDNLEMARLRAGEVTFYDLNGDVVEKEKVHIDWDAECAEKGGYEHFMMKEIREQPRVVKDTLNAFTREGKAELDVYGLAEQDLKGISQVVIVACGSAYHAGLVTQYVTEKIARIPCRVELASEFRYRDPILTPDTLVVAISQSGETADTLAALRLAKEKKIMTAAIVNVVGSSIAREADRVLYTKAGPEISVATTKAYSAQLITGYILAIALAKSKGLLTSEVEKGYISALESLPEKIESIFEDESAIQKLATQVAAEDDVFFVGRGIDYAVCMEGSLKLKEISYIHSEAYAAGELKHGTISLIEEGTFVVGVLTQSWLQEKTVSNMAEVKSRKGYLIAVTDDGNCGAEKIAEVVLYVPKIMDIFAASLAVIPLQLLSYFVSVNRGIDVDKPRNLAKSVTVE